MHIIYEIRLNLQQGNLCLLLYFHPRVLQFFLSHILDHPVNREACEIDILEAGPSCTDLSKCNNGRVGFAGYEESEGNVPPGSSWQKNGWLMGGTRVWLYPHWILNASLATNGFRIGWQGDLFCERENQHDPEVAQTKPWPFVFFWMGQDL